MVHVLNIRTVSIVSLIHNADGANLLLHASLAKKKKVLHVQLLMVIGVSLLFNQVLVLIVPILFLVKAVFLQIFVNGQLKMRNALEQCKRRMQLLVWNNARFHVINAQIVDRAWIKKEDVCGVKQHNNVLVFLFIRVNTSLVCVENG